MKHEVFYLAGPYTHRFAKIREKRFEELTLASAVLFARGIFNFSPITQSHQQTLSKDLPGTWQAWKEFDTEMIRRCDGLIVLTLDGWKESVGVTAEIKVAKKLGISIYHMRFIDEHHNFELTRVYHGKRKENFKKSSPVQ